MTPLLRADSVDRSPDEMAEESSGLQPLEPPPLPQHPPLPHPRFSTHPHRRSRSTSSSSATTAAAVTASPQSRSRRKASPKITLSPNSRKRTMKSSPSRSIKRLEDDQERSEEDENLPFPGFESKALFFFTQTNRLRYGCLVAITWPYPFRYTRLIDCMN